MPPTASLRAISLTSLGLLLALATGCSSDPGPGRSAGHAAHHKPVTPLAGEDTFFSGRLIAQLTVGDGIGPAGQPEGDRDGGSRRGGGGAHGGPGGGGLSFGGGTGGAHGGNRHERDAGPLAGEGGGQESPRPLMGSMAPPVMIHLRFTNLGTDRIQLRIDDFSSPLGNFAVQPEKLTLDPGQSLETEPMSSRLGDSLAETEATLVLRVGDQAEKKVIVLRAVPTTPKADANATPPAAAEQAPKQNP